jgi:hypothetical protein
MSRVDEALADRIATAVHLLHDDQGAVLGVAFRAGVVDSSRSGSFLITAAHVVRGQQRQAAPIFVVSAVGTHVVRTRVIDSVVSELDDVAVVYISESLGASLACVDLLPFMGTRSYVRGAPAGASTSLSTFEARIAGVEIANERTVLDVVLNDMSPLIADTPGRLPHVWRPDAIHGALKGLSGAPVVVGGPLGASGAIGVVTSRGTRLANRVVAVPIRTVAALLSQSGRILLLDRRPLSDTTLSHGRIEGALLAQVLGSREHEHEAWETLSALFYQGIPVDLFLHEQIEADRRNTRLSPTTAARARYLLARLMLKRGNLSEAKTLLHKLDAELPATGSGERARLAALVRLRLLIESPESVPWRQREEHLLRTLAAVEDRSEIPEPVRAYEVASAIGREAMTVAGVLARERSDTDIAAYFVRLAGRHRDLILDYPSLLVEKQEIVAIALATVGVLWGVTGPLGDPEQLSRLEAMARRGMVAARQRENAIFYSQMLIIIAVIARIRGDWPAAFRIAFIIGDVLQRAGIGTTHEGIGSLVRYARAYDSLLAEIISVAHTLGAHDGVVQLVSPAIRPRAEARELLSASAQAREAVETFEGLIDIFVIGTDGLPSEVPS